MDSFGAIGERRFDVFLRRTGLKNGAVETLQEIANVYGISRERVRQLEASGYDMMSQQFGDVRRLVRFATAWQSSKSLQAAAKKLGMEASHASANASKLRKAGFPLKLFPRGGGNGPKPLTARERAAVDPAVAARIEKNDRLEELWNCGFSAKAIAKELGYSAYGSVHAKVKCLVSQGYRIKTRTRTHSDMVESEVFIKAWNSSDGIDEVCEKTGMKRYAVSMRAGSLRARGIELKWFRKNVPYTAERLARLKLLAIEELEKCLKK